MTAIPFQAQQPIDFYRQHKKPLLIVASLLLLALVGFGDWLTGPDQPFALFYLIPVCFTAWFIGKWSGHVMALMSAAVWLWADLAGAAINSHAIYEFSNSVMRLGFFVTTVLIIAAWKDFGNRLSLMVEERTAELRREMEQREQGARAIKQLAAQLSQAEQAERRRLAHEIHDSLGQMLTLLKLNLETGAAATTRAAGEGNGHSSEALRIVEDLIKQTRALTFELHPAMLDDLGLTQTLQWYASQFQRRAQQVEVTVSEHGTRRKPPQTLTNYVFRAVKELLSNALKHGRAREIVIGLHWEPNMLRVVVDDDGSGFEPLAVAGLQGAGKLGLAGIRERLSSFGGAMRIESGKGQGTRVILEAPLE